MDNHNERENDNLTIRSAEITDYTAIAEVNHSAFERDNELSLNLRH